MLLMLYVMTAHMATNETWSPAGHHQQQQQHVNNSVLIEHDPEPTSPTLPHPS
ncbi:hypothetical protein DOY81_013206 [Sarcophaga bullata]|nr:hypothetical protein DOY81_013206 [Sarcophaga bullata]